MIVKKIKKHVLIMGGGVAGLTAAHELVERGFAVTVLEAHSFLGGKSKSVPFPNSGTAGRRDLPGEHGFRIFPGFYQHLPHTLSRIPYKDSSVMDNVVGTRETFIGNDEQTTICIQNNFRGLIGQIIALLRGRHHLQQAGVRDEDIDFFLQKIWQILTSCRTRRDTELDTISWWEFMEADKRPLAYRQHMVINSTKTLVASDPVRASARTIGQIAIQVLRDLFHINCAPDRVLNGPTNDVWIDPWYDYLTSKGVVVHSDTLVVSINEDRYSVIGITCQTKDTELNFTADYYVLATPVEVSAELLHPLRELDDQFGDLTVLSQMTNWMNGIQYYLYVDVPIVHGHQILSTTKWALTSISQAQFWSETDIASRGDGTVRGVLSVIIADWHAIGDLYGRSAMECTPQEIADEVWYQLKGVLNQQNIVRLEDSNQHSWFLDPDIQRGHQNPHDSINLEPLLVNLINGWELRPLSVTKLSNLFLAGDYVKNNTDLATMEGANETGRRAANAILDASGDNSARAKVWPLWEPAYAWPLQWYDRRRFERGLPWNPKPPLWLRWPFSFLVRLYKLARRIARLLPSTKI